MALRRFNAKRDAVEPEIVKAFQSMGCAVRRLDQPCDLLVNVPWVPMCDRTILVEVKSGKAKLNELQKQFIAEGWTVHIIRSAEEAIELVKQLRRAA